MSLVKYTSLCLTFWFCSGKVCTSVLTTFASLNYKRVLFPAIGHNVNSLYLITNSLHVVTSWTIVQSLLTILKHFQACDTFRWNHFSRQVSSIFSSTSISLNPFTTYKYQRCQHFCLSCSKWIQAGLSFHFSTFVTEGAEEYRTKALYRLYILHIQNI